MQFVFLFISLRKAFKIKNQKNFRTFLKARKSKSSELQIQNFENLGGGSQIFKMFWISYKRWSKRHKKTNSTLNFSKKFKIFGNWSEVSDFQNFLKIKKFPIIWGGGGGGNLNWEKFPNFPDFFFDGFPKVVWANCLRWRSLILHFITVWSILYYSIL